MLEIRILSGARAGQAERFDKPVIVIGRHPSVDLRFSPEQDLDVSTKHAEIRLTEGRYVLQDTGSTNGTFVNGRRIETNGTAVLREGDKLRFGAKGPEAIVVMEGVETAPVPRAAKPRSTEVRVAEAVRKQTAGLKMLMAVAVALLVVGIGAAYYMGARGRGGSDAQQLNKPLPDSMRALLQRDRNGGDTTVLNRVQMDLPAIHARNAPAIALIVSEINGKPFAGTGFAITPEGLLVTNRHNVRDESGHAATRLAVKFVNTKAWLHAKVVRVSDTGNDDLALVQMEEGGPFPVVEGLSRGTTGVSEGNSVVTIGFPLAYDTPMEGEGNDFVAKSTLNPGTVSKRTSSVLQIDSYAAHGSSGSPVFDARGLVVGVVWGGPPEGAGRIVYAVPPDRLASFIPAEYRAIVKD